MTQPTRRTVLAASLLALHPLARSQPAAWPRRSIRFVVPFAPGGTSEIVARSVAAELSKQLGQTVFVDNKGGGAGQPAMTDVAKAAPDGHTIILGHVGSLAVNPYIFPNQPYDVNKDFVPVTLLAKVPNLFVIHPEVPAQNFKEFVAYAKQAVVETVVVLGQLARKRLEVGLDRVHRRHQRSAQGAALGQGQQVFVVRSSRQHQGAAAHEVGGHQFSARHLAGFPIGFDGRQRRVIPVAGVAKKNHPQHRHAVFAARQLGVGAQLVGGFPQTGFDLVEFGQGAGHRSVEGMWRFSFTREQAMTSDAALYRDLAEGPGQHEWR